MKMKKFIKKSSLLGISAITSVALLLFGTLVFSFFNIGVDGAYGMNVDWSAVGMTMAPRLLVLTFLFYLSLKISRDQELPIKKNNVIAFALIGIGVAYFAYRTTSFWQDGGGWIWPVVYFLESLLFIVFGIALWENQEK